MTKRQLMKRAHKLAKKMKGDYQARLSLALRQLWKKKKGEDKMVRVIKERGKRFKVEGSESWLVDLIGKEWGADEGAEIVNVLCELGRREGNNLETRDKLICECKEEEFIEAMEDLEFLSDYQVKLKEAKKEGEKVFWKRWNEDCTDKREQCDIDIVKLYVLPDGNTETVRIHTC